MKNVFRVILTTLLLITITTSCQNKPSDKYIIPPLSERLQPVVDNDASTDDYKITQADTTIFRLKQGSLSQYEKIDVLAGTKYLPVVEMVKVSPSWQQSFYYAFKSSSYTTLFIIGTLSLLFGLYVFYMVVIKKYDYDLIQKVIIMALCVLLSMVCILTKPSKIHFDNNTLIPKSTFDVLKSTGHLEVIQDSLYSNRKLQGA